MGLLTFTNGTTKRAIPISTIADQARFFGSDKQQRILDFIYLEDFRECETLRQQIWFSLPFLREPVDNAFTFNEMATVFAQPNESSIRHHLRQGNEEPNPCGRRAILTDDIYKMVIELVTQRVSDHHPITYGEILDQIEYQFHTVIQPATLRAMLNRKHDVKTIIGNPIEEERAAVTVDQINEWLEKLVAAIDGVPRKFIFNMDETGCIEHVDTHRHKVVVPFSFPNKVIPVPVNRHDKRATMAVCIAADGFRMKPFVIIPRKTVEQEVFYYGYTSDYVEFTSQEHAYMTCPLFNIWGDTVFFPTIERMRNETGYQGKAVLLLDGVGSHHTREFLDKCDLYNVEVLEFVPHASHILQPLDLVNFAIFKRRFSSSKFNKLQNPQSNKIVRMMSAWYQASAPHHNVVAFQNLGLIPALGADGVFYLRFDRASCRNLHLAAPSPQPAPSASPEPMAQAPLPPESQRRSPVLQGHAEPRQVGGSAREPRMAGGSANVRAMVMEPRQEPLRGLPISRASLEQSPMFSSGCADIWGALETIQEETGTGESLEELLKDTQEKGHPREKPRRKKDTQGGRLMQTMTPSEG
jgi:hypothetical protein